MKNILVIITGLNPQVIIKVLYALHQSMRKVDVIYMIAARDRKDMVYSALFVSKNDQYFRYHEGCGIPTASI